MIPALLMNFSPIHSTSYTAMVRASAVSLTRLINSLPIGGDNALDDLQQRYLEENLALGHAEHLTGLILTARDTLNAAAEVSEK